MCVTTKKLRCAEIKLARMMLQLSDLALKWAGDPRVSREESEELFGISSDLYQAVCGLSAELGTEKASYETEFDLQYDHDTLDWNEL